jgi:hypothetical protein
MITVLQSVDRFLLGLDHIYQNATILAVTGDSLRHNNITARTLKRYDSKLLVIVTITPTPETEYQLSDGAIYHRLNASNFRITKTKFIAENQMRHMLLQERQKITAEYDDYLGALKTELETVARDKDDVAKLLQSKILLEKQQYETILASPEREHHHRPPRQFVKAFRNNSDGGSYLAWIFCPCDPSCSCCASSSGSDTYGRGRTRSDGLFSLFALCCAPFFGPNRRSLRVPRMDVELEDSELLEGVED